LSRACDPEIEVEVLAATQKIDVYSVPDPARAADQTQMACSAAVTRCEAWSCASSCSTCADPIAAR
jgi:hypothetical protein